MKTTKDQRTHGAWPILIGALALLVCASAGFAASISGSNAGNVSIPDAGGYVSSTITISGAPSGATVTGIDVYFRCVHSYSGDLVVDLNADSTGSLGNRNLWNREGGAADDPTRTTTGITTFNGLSVNRTWYLYAKDFVAGDGGYIDEWTITVYYTASVTPSITGVSPNPVTGSNTQQPFTVNGNNFVSGCNVTLRDLTAGEVFANRAISSFSANQIVINPIFTTAAHSWSVEVINPGGTSSGQFNFNVLAPVVTPAVTGVSPNPVTGSNAQQPFTVNGNNFVSGCNVTLRDLSSGEVFANRAIGSFSANQIVINPIFTTAAHSWSVEVINPGGASSGQFNFSVLAPVVTPTITGVSPNPVTGSNTQQPFTINGNSFVSGCSVTLRDLSTGEVFANRAIGSFSANQIVINPIFTTAAHNWSVEVINPGGASSGQFNFSVLAPVVTPSVTSVSPNPVTGSNTQQPFTINGNSFVSGCNVTLRDLATGEVFPNRAIGSFSANQIVINPIFTTAAHNWSVEVINPGGASSGQFNFNVVSPPVAPTIAGVSPNPVIGSSVAQPFTIVGNNFVAGCNVILRDQTANEVFPNRAIGALSANQIVINPIFTTAAHNWSVEVINPSGASSGQFSFTVVSPTGDFYVSFPLPNRTPYTAKINSVFDHAKASGVVLAFTGERGEEQYGRLSANDPSFMQPGGYSFVVTGNGNYTGGGYPNYLSYDGHMGFDYRTTDQDPVNGRINVLAAAPGTVHWISGSQYNTVEIDHGNGYRTRYLHLSTRQAGLDGVAVSRGQVIGISGDTGVPGSPHLHFEVLLNGVPVDPYGWSGVGIDPYRTATGVENVNLWNEPPGCNYVVAPVSRSHGSSADSGTITVTAGVGCAWTATPLSPWITIVSGASGSGNGWVTYSVSANSSGSMRTGAISVQGTSVSISQAGTVGNRIYGFDVSSVGQGVISLDQWVQAKNAGKSFAWIRASKGDANSDGDCRFLDPKFQVNINNARAAGLAVGAYHVGNVVQSSAADEADFFVNVAGDYLKPGYLRPVLDLESHSCGDPAALGVSALSVWVDQWATKVQMLTGVSPVIYCNQAFLANLDASLAQKYDLWVAKFTENPESAVPVAPWNGWIAFQYSQSGSVAGITPVDLNVFQGTSAEFQSRLVIATPQLTGLGGGGVLPPINGQFQCEVSAPSQRQVVIQGCEDLVNWVDLSPVVIVNGKGTFTDANAHQKMFYRPKQ